MKLGIPAEVLKTASEAFLKNLNIHIANIFYRKK